MTIPKEKPRLFLVGNTAGTSNEQPVTDYPEIDRKTGIIRFPPITLDTDLDAAGRAWNRFLRKRHCIPETGLAGVRVEKKAA